VIGTVIVGGSLALAVLFAAAWLLRPAWRSAIEAPKHGFAARVRAYDRACREPGEQKTPSEAP
jgi:hypothetical protein